MIKFSCEKALLQSAISVASRAVAAKSSIRLLVVTFSPPEMHFSIPGMPNGESRELVKEKLNNILNVYCDQALYEEAKNIGSVILIRIDDYYFGKIKVPMAENGIPNFDHPDALFTGFETRSSSPIRLPRNEAYESNVRGIYPAGEGAGYAGGITSAAADGIHVAEKIASVYQKIKIIEK